MEKNNTPQLHLDLVKAILLVTTSLLEKENINCSKRINKIIKIR